MSYNPFSITRERQAELDAIIETAKQVHTNGENLTSYAQYATFANHVQSIAERTFKTHILPNDFNYIDNVCIKEIREYVQLNMTIEQIQAGWNDVSHEQRMKAGGPFPVVAVNNDDEILENAS